MQSISRQVQKKRKGITVPINEHKRQRFIQNLYLDAELKKLDTLLDENDVNFDGKLLFRFFLRFYFSRKYNSLKAKTFIFRSYIKGRTRTTQR